MTTAELQAENDKLRAEVESFKQRELADLKAQLAAALEAATHYRNEALRIAESVKQVNALAEETISSLRAQLAARDQSKLEAIRSRPRADIRRN